MPDVPLVDLPLTDVVERPRIDPRIARRWIDARRAEGRRRLRVLIGVGVVVGLAGLALGSLYSPIFEVRHGRATVDGPIPVARVVGLTGLDRHPLMIDVSPGAVAARLDADPWLGAAQVRLSWPGTVRLSVAVRSPIAVVPAAGAGSGGPGAWAEVDVTGRVLADTIAPPPGLPQMTGAGLAPAPGGWLPGALGPGADPLRAVGALVDLTASSDGPDVPRGIDAALAVVSALPAAVRADVAAVTVGPGPGLALTISPPRDATGTVRVNLGDGSALQAKLTSLLTLLAQADLSGVSAVDLSVPGRPAALTART
jgi:hypothetical protein